MKIVKTTVSKVVLKKIYLAKLGEEFKTTKPNNIQPFWRSWQKVSNICAKIVRFLCIVWRRWLLIISLTKLCTSKWVPFCAFYKVYYTTTNVIQCWRLFFHKKGSMSNVQLSCDKLNFPFLTNLKWKFVQWFRHLIICRDFSQEKVSNW